MTNRVKWCFCGRRIGHFVHSGMSALSRRVLHRINLLWSRNKFSCRIKHILCFSVVNSAFTLLKHSPCTVLMRNNSARVYSSCWMHFCAASLVENAKNVTYCSNQFCQSSKPINVDNCSAICVRRTNMNVGDRECG